MYKLLLVDNYDSFTYNIAGIIRSFGDINITVKKNNDLNIEEVNQYDQIILSPGPGLPSEAGIMQEIIIRYAKTKKILGICLGHQGIGEAFNCRLINLKVKYHGRSSTVLISDPTQKIFSNIPIKFQGGRYHSWVISNEELSDDIIVIATDKIGSIMAIKHKQFDVTGVQFHPESILTDCGEKMLRNWVYL